MMHGRRLAPVPDRRRPCVQAAAFRQRPVTGLRRERPPRLIGCAPASGVRRCFSRSCRPIGLTAHDGAQVPGIQVGNLFGNQTIVRDLEEVWAAAERLSGKPIDPLDPRFIGGDESV